MVRISNKALDIILRKARTCYNWLRKDIEDAILEEIYDLCKMGPTATNSCPMRIIYLKSIKSKTDVVPFLEKGNVEQTIAAPITAIIAYDLEFYKKLPKLYPHADACSWYKGDKSLVLETAFRNSTLQGAYFIIAARSLGLDCCPISGFNNIELDKKFFPNKKIKSNFLCNLGYGDKKSLLTRDYRLPFNEVVTIL